MPILKTKQTWKRAPDPNSLREKNRLLPIEEERVRRAMRVLHVRYGNWCRVADALGHHRVTVERVLNIRRTAAPAFAMRVARLLGVSLGDVLSGAWPKPGSVRCAAPQSTKGHDSHRGLLGARAQGLNLFSCSECTSQPPPRASMGFWVADRSDAP